MKKENNKLGLEQIVVTGDGSFNVCIHIPREEKFKYHGDYNINTQENSIALNNVQDYANKTNNLILNLEELGFSQRFLESNIELELNKNILFKYEPFFVPRLIDSALKKVYGNANYLTGGEKIEIFVNFDNMDFKNGKINFSKERCYSIDFEACHDLASVNYLKESKDYIIKTPKDFEVERILKKRASSLINLVRKIPEKELKVTIEEYRDRIDCLGQVKSITALDKPSHPFYDKAHKIKLKGLKRNELRGYDEEIAEISGKLKIYEDELKIKKYESKILNKKIKIY